MAAAQTVDTLTFRSGVPEMTKPIGGTSGFARASCGSGNVMAPQRSACGNGKASGEGHFSRARRAPTRVIERQIARKLMHKLAAAEASRHRADAHTFAERLIAVLAATAGVFLLGTYLQELLWAALGVATILMLGLSGSDI